MLLKVKYVEDNINLIANINSFLEILILCWMCVGEQGTSLLKRWIDANYRVVRAYSKLQFLKRCKFTNIHPQYISYCTKTPFNVFHFKAIQKLMAYYTILFEIIEFEIIEIEIFDLNKFTHFSNKELSSLSRDLSNYLPSFIWN